MLRESRILFIIWDVRPSSILSKSEPPCHDVSSLILALDDADLSGVYLTSVGEHCSEPCNKTEDSVSMSRSCVTVSSNKFSISLLTSQWRIGNKTVYVRRKLFVSRQNGIAHIPCLPCSFAMFRAANQGRCCSSSKSSGPCMVVSQLLRHLRQFKLESVFVQQL